MTLNFILHVQLVTITILLLLARQNLVLNKGEGSISFSSVKLETEPPM